MRKISHTKQLINGLQGKSEYIFFHGILSVHKCTQSEVSASPHPLQPATTTLTHPRENHVAYSY